MSMSVNKATLLGNVGKAPELRTFQDGREIITFSVATTESWKDKHTGEPKESTEWHNIVVSGILVNIAKMYIQSGIKIYIEGKIKKSEKDGKWYTNIVVDGFNTFFISLSNNPGTAPKQIQTDYTKQLPGMALQQNASGADDTLNDDIPF